MNAALVEVDKNNIKNVRIAWDFSGNNPIVDCEKIKVYLEKKFPDRIWATASDSSARAAYEKSVADGTVDPKFSNLATWNLD